MSGFGKDDVRQEPAKKRLRYALASGEARVLKSTKTVKQLSSLARLCDNVYYRRPAAFNDFDRFVQGWPELIRLGNRTKTGYVQCPRDCRQIRCRLFDADSDALIFNRPLAPA